MKWKLFMLMMTGFLLLTCEGEEINPARVRKGIRLTAEIEGVKTRLSGSVWEKGDAIGIYMKKAGTTLDASALASNVAHRYNDSTHTFMPGNPADSLFFPFSGSNVDLIGYYPYRKDLTNYTLPVNLTVQSDQESLDLMYSDNATGRNMGNAEVKLTFSHRLSKVVFLINHYREIDLTGLSVILTHVPTEASFNLVNGTLSPSGETMDIATAVNKEGSVAEAILLPGTDLSGSNFWFTLSDDQVFHVPSGSLSIGSLSPSTRYTFHITLYTDEKAVISSGEVADWITGPSSTLTADRTEDSPPAIKGSVSDPYTVSQAIIHQGKTGVWVKGYIVGAFDKAISKFVTDSTGQVKTNVALAENAGENDVTHMLPVNFTTTTLKNSLNIVDNPDNIGRAVMIKGNLAAYYSVPGLRETTDCRFFDP